MAETPGETFARLGALSRTRALSHGESVALEKAQKQMHAVKRRWDDDDIVQLRRLARSGERRLTIAAKLARSEQAIRDKAREIGIEVRP